MNLTKISFFEIRDLSFRCLISVRKAIPKHPAYAVLLYHQIINDCKKCCILRPNQCVERYDFIRQMEHIKEYSRVIDLDELYERILQGIRPDGFYIAVTFDDGYKNNIDIALPILRSLKIPATFFITTSFIEQQIIPWWDEWSYKILLTNKPIDLKLGQYAPSHWDLTTIEGKKQLLSKLTNVMKQNHEMKKEIDDYLCEVSGITTVPRLYMNWEELKWLSQQKGILIGSHSVSHRRNTQVQSRLTDEILPSKRIIEEKIGGAIKFYSYPFGTRTELNESMYQDVKTAGFLAAFTSIEGFNHPLDNPFSLKRIPVVGGESFERFLTRLYVSDLIGYLKYRVM